MLALALYSRTIDDLYELFDATYDNPATKHSPTACETRTIIGHAIDQKIYA